MKDIFDNIRRSDFTRKDRKLKIKLDKDTTEKKYRLIKETDLQPYTFKNEKEVVCLNEKNCQSNSSNSDKDLSNRILSISYYKYILLLVYNSDPLNRL